jgi:hypothetical protein
MKRLMIGLILGLILAACGGDQASDTPVGAVENYLKMKVSGDRNKTIAVSCKAWENRAITEVDSLKARDPKLEGVSCKQGGTEAGFTLVSCEGQIQTSYQGESRPLPLSEKLFKTIQEDGHWKMCGYQ